MHGRDARLPTTAFVPSDDEARHDVHDYSLVVTRRLRRAIEIANQYQLEADVKRKEYYDRRQYAVELAPGTLVLLHNPTHKVGLAVKLQERFTGPYRVQRRLSNVNYEISHLQTQQVLTTHVRRIILYYPPLEKNYFTKKLALTCSAHHAHDDGCILMYPGERRHMTTELEAFPLRRTSSCPKLGMWRPQEDGVQRLTEEEIRPTERESRDGVDPHWPGDIRTDGTAFSATSTYPTGSTGFAGQPAFPSTSGNGAPPSRSRRATAGQPPKRFADQDW